MGAAFTYPGQELELFAGARCWKAYWSSQMAAFVRGRVLEVGAGTGSNTALLWQPTHQWTCLEPDPQLLDRLIEHVAAARLPVTARHGTISDLSEDARFDTILYLDVLEHIEDDRTELQQAASRLCPGGHLIVLAPAHQALFSDFDRAIGHHRRYSRPSLLAVAPPALTVVRARYLDAVGLSVSFANRHLLRQSTPTRGQIQFWDRTLVRTSRVVDPLLGYRAGKSVLAIWRLRTDQDGAL